MFEDFKMEGWFENKWQFRRVFFFWVVRFKEDSGRCLREDRELGKFKLLFL